MDLVNFTRIPFSFFIVAQNLIDVVSTAFLFHNFNPFFLEYMKILQAVSIGFALMGFIGYFVKLVHIPINNIIVGGAA